MSRYVVLRWRNLGPVAEARLGRALRGLGTAQGWSLALRAEGLAVAVCSDVPLAVKLIGADGVLVGEVHPKRPGASPGFGGLRGADAVRLCQDLSANCWGRYVVVAPRESDQALKVFRDPMGALECLAWTFDTVEVVASDLPDWLSAELAPHVALNPAQVANFVGSATAFAGRLGLSGLDAVTPGALLTLQDGRAAETAIWTPAMVVKSGRNGGEACDLVTTLDQVVEALAGTRRIMMEVSGGLDSAIVATSLARTKAAEVVAWLNYHLPTPEGDERSYARAVAQAAGFELTEAQKPRLVLDERWLEALGEGVRPGLNALDWAYDQDVCARLLDTRAQSLMTGRGGDTVFFQMANPLVFADHLVDAGLCGAFDGTAGDVARWTRRSVWSVIGESLWALRPSWARPHGGAPVHPWLEGLDDLAPAKAAQIKSLTSCLAYMIDCGRARRARYLHPLLAQPMVEACLRTPSAILTAGKRDRALARQVFEGRLPAIVARRRGKGDATSVFSQAVAEQAPLLQAFILDGRLAQMGLIERQALEAAMNREALMWRGGHGRIMHLCIVEAWLRAWERRIALQSARGALASI